jgi:hypothetical protein
MANFEEINQLDTSSLSLDEYFKWYLDIELI